MAGRSENLSRELYREMAQLGRLRFVVQDTAGNAVAGASVQVRRQGANCSGAQSGSPLNVDAINGIVAGDEIVNGTAVTQRTVSAITGTTVTCGVGFNVTDDDRLSIVSPLPSLFIDAQGNEAASNPLTSSSIGVAECYAYGGLYDALVSGGGLTTMLYQDVGTEGFAGRIRSNVYSGESYHLDHLRVLAATDEALIVSHNSDVADLFKVMGDGEIQAGIAGATHALTGNTTITGTLTSSGALTVQAGGAAVTGAVTATTSIDATTTVSAGTGITATTGNIQATAGDFDGRRLIMNNGTTLVGADVAISAGWGNTALISSFGGSKDTRGRLQIVANGAGIAANPTVTITFKDGTYGTAPLILASRGDAVAPAAGYWAGGVPSATQAAWTFVETPVAGSTYVLQFLVIG